jgi:deoxyribonuclease-4
MERHTQTTTRVEGVHRTIPYLGAHMSISGGLFRAVERAAEVGATALQVFTRNPRQWACPEMGEDEVAAFRAAWRGWGHYPIAAHTPYLINLAAPDDMLGDKSTEAFARELERTERLGVPHLVLHPGARTGQGVKQGITRFTHRLDAAFTISAAKRVNVLLEVTAGQGTQLGSSFAQLSEVLEQSRFCDRLGCCFDTCHVFAAGYDFRTRATYEQTIKEWDRLIGLERLKLFHCNDSIYGLGTAKDRHAHIGKGQIGLSGFSLILNDRRFALIPKILETPKGNGLQKDLQNLKTLRKLIR